MRIVYGIGLPMQTLDCGDFVRRFNEYRILSTKNQMIKPARQFAVAPVLYFFEQC